jgi:hypothetical protein
VCECLERESGLSERERERTKKADRKSRVQKRGLGRRGEGGVRFVDRVRCVRSKVGLVVYVGKGYIKESERERVCVLRRKKSKIGRRAIKECKSLRY